MQSIDKTNRHSINSKTITKHERKSEFIMSSFEIENHVAIITGSAQGMGKEIAKRLLEAGARVCISDIR